MQIQPAQTQPAQTQPAQIQPAQIQPGGVLGRHHLGLTAAVGGPARRTVVVLLAAVLGLEAADSGAVGALAAPLERAFDVGDTQIGILVAASTLVGAVATLPFGGLVDRVDRSRLLQATVAVWAVATVVGAVSVDYTMLLLSRLALGGVVAVAGPAVASLVGDLFPATERSRLYGYVLTGELIGAGVGILAAGLLSAPLGWRVALGVLALPAAVLVVTLHRHFPEPARGGQAHLAEGDTEIVTAAEAAHHDAGSGRLERPPAVEGVGMAVDADHRAAVSASGRDAGGADCDTAGEPEASAVATQAEGDGARPAPGTVVSHADAGIWAVTRYILRVRTNDALIVASGLGYFFFGGLQTFAELFFRERYGVGQAVASLLFILVAGGALVGVLASGRIADSRIASGHTAARLTVGGVAYIATALIFIPGALTTVLWIALPVFVVAAAGLGGTNPPVDAARLDVMPPEFWGRAEGVRTALRQLLQGIAPVVIGLLSAAFGAGGSAVGAGVDTSGAHLSRAGGDGLADAFVIVALPMLAAGAVLLASRSRYLRDAVAAMRSARAMSPG